VTRSTPWTVTSEKILTQEQIERLLGLLTERRDLAIARSNQPQHIKDYYIVRTLLETGVRVFEFCNLIEDDLHGMKLFVRRGKGGKARTILITRSTMQMLQEWMTVKEKLGFQRGSSEPLFPSRYSRKYTTRGIQKRIDLVFELTDLPQRLSTHSCRHTNCSLLLASGKVSLATVKENLGHNSIAVTNLYAHTVGNIDDVEIYSAPGSQISDKSELEKSSMRAKANVGPSHIKGFLRNANFKRGDRKRRKSGGINEE